MTPDFFPKRTNCLRLSGNTEYNIFPLILEKQMVMIMDSDAGAINDSAKFCNGLHVVERIPGICTGATNNSLRVSGH